MDNQESYGDNSGFIKSTNSVPFNLVTSTPQDTKQLKKDNEDSIESDVSTVQSDFDLNVGSGADDANHRAPLSAQSAPPFQLKSEHPDGLPERLPLVRHGGEVHSPENQTCLRNRFSQLVCTDSSRTDNCLPFSRARSAQYLSMGKTSLLLIRQGTAYQYTPNERGWVRATRRNLLPGATWGQLELTLHNQNGKIAYFKKGRFKGTLVRPGQARLT